MSEHLRPPPPAPAPASAPSHSPTLHAADTKYEGQDPEVDLTIGTRTPKPYYRQSFELLEPSERLIHRAATVALSQSQLSPTSAHSSNPASDSGTEADDEHFLKGLPAPKTRLHKGLRGKNEPLSGTSTPLLSSNAIDEDGRDPDLNPRSGTSIRTKRGEAERGRRRKEVVRRGAEVLLLACQGLLVASNHDVQPFLRSHRKELSALCWLSLTLLALYPLRLVAWAYRRGNPSKRLPLSVPTSFDPAPALYPQLIPLFVSLLVAQNVEGVVLPNVILSICSLPRPLIPGAGHWEEYSSTQWLLSCIPLVLGSSAADSEILALLYPLHQTLCLLLQRLTTTSLLIAELQLLSVALINVLLLAQSPQVVILKALLWGGGLGIIVLCGKVIQWGISLARVPKWRFKRPSTPKAGNTSGLWRFFKAAKRTYYDGKTDNEEVSSDSDDMGSGYRRHRNSATSSWDASFSKGRTREDSISSAEESSLRQANGTDVRFDVQEPPSPQQSSPRRHTLPSLGKIASIVRSQTSTPSGRRKRSASSSVRAFFSLTQGQAAVRKWLYAGWVYVCILITLLVGVREYVGRYALAENEPVGWALGYLFGDIPQLRLEVVKADLERWICLPIRADGEASGALGGWVQFVRQSIFGEANTRLLLSGYWLVVIIIGLAVVFRLSPIYEVDTRRKVFHFMMVAMFLPTIFIDPTYIALALSIVLAIFLLVDLLRASQLPPLSTPIAQFLTPYVDGRDLRGPVVISHIFLLIGCAIPLWLSLAALPRTGEGPLAGWEVPLRDISMVAGVVCVGLGDAAASLIGRRWGHRKWLWGGGKSIEGSIAFATAVFVGLMTANIWLFVGGWPSTVGTLSTVAREAELNDGFGAGAGAGASVGELVMDIMGRLWEALSQLPQASWSTTVVKTAACACMASLTEAVLTGGNDNVVVPVVLWTCVKSMDMNLR